MKNRIFTIIAFLMFLSTASIGQIEQVSIGEGYGQQAYYNLETGSSFHLDNDAWEVAFSNTGFTDAGVFINESVSSGGAALEVFLAESESWDEEIIIDQSFDGNSPLYNPELNWDEGAFNTVKDETSPFDYGWGVYNPQNHNIEGNRIFVIKMRDDSYIKMQVVNFANSTYNIRYADLDGANEKSIAVDKTASDDPIILVSLSDETIIDIPMEYDLIFQRYKTLLDAGDGTSIQYDVAGILLSSGSEAVLIEEDAIDVELSDYSDSFDSRPTLIGHEWKYFDFSAGWVIDEIRSQLVKTRNDEVYHIKFLDFEGSSTGIATLEKTYLETITTTVESPVMTDISIYPNPTSDLLTIDSDIDAEVELAVYNQMGQMVLRTSTSTNREIEVRHLPAGNYTLQSMVNGELNVQKLVIVRF